MKVRDSFTFEYEAIILELLPLEKKIEVDSTGC